MSGRWGIHMTGMRIVTREVDGLAGRVPVAENYAHTA